jgi:phage terminase large subunit GpA-like protein
VLIGSPSPVDVTVSGRKLKRGYKVWPIATNLAKSELYGWLALQRLPTD